MMYDLDFISEEDFKKHIKLTIESYGDKLKSFDLKKFNSNIIDPIKLTFDKAIFNSSWEVVIKNEIARQRDKSNNNEIGYFHQNFFKYIKNCEVPKTGWDVIYRNKDGILLPNEEVVHTVYVEMKNKHNTMNSSSSAKTMMRMQNQLLHDDDCACFLVEAIAKTSQNIIWSTTIDGSKVENNKIRRVSMDKFYALITNDEEAFYKMCIQLPKMVDEIIMQRLANIIPNDTVFEDLNKISNTKNIYLLLWHYICWVLHLILGFKTNNIKCF